MKKLVSLVLCVFVLSTVMAEARPARWCGWYQRTQVRQDPGPMYNLARNWKYYGSNARGPDIGVIVVWPRHVGQIVARGYRGWVVRSGNDGNRVRERERSLRGVIAYRWDTGHNPFQRTYERRYRRHYAMR